MINDSRTDIYNYLYNLFYGVVTENVYVMDEPQELTENDYSEGFIVIRVGDIYDEGEFSLETYGTVRCYVSAYIPPMSRGRLDITKYRVFEDGIMGVIKSAAQSVDGDYYVHEDNILSTDIETIGNSDNVFFTFIKSFVVEIDNNSN